MFKIKCILISLGFIASVLSQSSDFKMYGYFDLEFEYNADKKERWDIDQHHFNVVTIYQLDKNWRIYSEIEWEHGVEVEPSNGVAGGSGKVAVERAWIEYKYSNSFQIKAGKYLAPFGLMNLSHDATPTILLSFLPSSIYGSHKTPAGYKSRLYPKFGAGVQVLGDVNITNNSWLHYVFYISNGEGSAAYKKDDNKNKGLGARLLYSFMNDNMSLGMSFYSQKYGNGFNTQHDVIAFDLKTSYDHFAFQVEAFFPKMEAVDTNQVANGVMTNILGYYGQLSYTFSDTYTPVFQYNYYDGDTSVDDNEETKFTFGLNIAVTSRVFLKGEYQMIQFDDSEKNYNSFISSISVAF
jgi:hypothetical protein